MEFNLTRIEEWPCRLVLSASSSVAIEASARASSSGAIVSCVGSSNRSEINNVSSCKQAAVIVEIVLSMLTGQLTGTSSPNLMVRSDSRHLCKRTLATGSFLFVMPHKLLQGPFVAAEKLMQELKFDILNDIDQQITTHIVRNTLYPSSRYLSRNHSDHETRRHPKRFDEPFLADETDFDCQRRRFARPCCP